MPMPTISTPMDISQVPTSQLMQMAGINQQGGVQNVPAPQGTDLSKIPTDQLMHMAGINQQTPNQTTNSDQTPQNTSDSRSLLSKGADYINAIGGGIQETLGNSIKYGTGLIGDLTNSPNLTSIGAKVGNTLGRRPDFIEQAQQENPSMSTAGNALGGLGAMGLTTAAIAMALPEEAAGSIGYISNALVGAATSGQGLVNRLIGGIGGAALTKLGNIGSSAVSKVIDKINIPKQFSKIISESKVNTTGLTTNQAATASIKNMWQYATQLRDELANNFKLVPGKTDIENIGQQAQSALTKLKPFMTPGQQGLFNTVALQAPQIDNLNALHTLAKKIGSQSALFNTGVTDDTVRQAYTDLRNGLTHELETHAEQFGVGSDLQLFNKFNNAVIKPLQQFGADKIASGEKSIDGVLSKYVATPSVKNPGGSPESLGKLLNAMDSQGKSIITNHFIQQVSQAIQTGADGISPSKGIKLINNNIDIYGQYIGQDGVDRLQGLKKLITAMPDITSSGMKKMNPAAEFLKHNALSIGMGIAGAGHGYSNNGLLGAIGEAGTGIAAAKLGGALLESKAGAAILEFIGEHPKGAALAKKLLLNSFNDGITSLSAGIGTLDRKLAQ